MGTAEHAGLLIDRATAISEQSGRRQLRPDLLSERHYAAARYSSSRIVIEQSVSTADQHHSLRHLDPATPDHFVAVVVERAVAEQEASLEYRKVGEEVVLPIVARPIYG